MATIKPNRYTRTRTRPVNPSRPVPRPAPAGPTLPGPRPGVEIGVPMQPPGQRYTRNTQVRTRPVNPSRPVPPPAGPTLPGPRPGVEIGVPMQPPGQQSNNDFYNSPEYKNFLDNDTGIGTMDMYDSPYFGQQSSGSRGRAQDRAYEAYLNRTGQQAGPVTAAQQVLSSPGIQNVIGTVPGIFGNMTNQFQQSQDPNTQAMGNLVAGIGGMVQPTIGSMANAIGNQFGLGNAGGKSAPAQPGGPSMGFGAQAPIGQETNPNYQNYSNYQPTQQQSFLDYQNAVFGNQPNIYQPNFGGNTGVGGKSSGFQPTQATQQNPNVSIGFAGPGMANQTGPQSGGFNPSLGNTTLPGNF